MLRIFRRFIFQPVIYLSILLAAAVTVGTIAHIMGHEYVWYLYLMPKHAPFEILYFPHMLLIGAQGVALVFAVPMWIKSRRLEGDPDGEFRRYRRFYAWELRIFLSLLTMLYICSLNIFLVSAVDPTFRFLFEFPLIFTSISACLTVMYYSLVHFEYKEAHIE